MENVWAVGIHLGSGFRNEGIMCGIWYTADTCDKHLILRMRTSRKFILIHERVVFTCHSSNERDEWNLHNLLLTLL